MSIQVAQCGAVIHNWHSDDLLLRVQNCIKDNRHGALSEFMISYMYFPIEPKCNA